MKNKFNIILGCIWLVVALFLLNILIRRMNGSRSDRRILFNSSLADSIFGDTGIVINEDDLSGGNITTLYKNYNFSTEGIEEFDIDLISASVHFQAGNDSDIGIGLYGNWNKDIEPTVQSGRGKIIIKSPQYTIKNKVNLSSRKVVITIPQSVLDKPFNAEINTVSGSIHTDAITFNTLTAETTSGSVHLDGDINILTANSVSGSIHTSGTCSNCTCETVSGSIHIGTDKPLTGKNNFNSVSGSIHLTIPAQSGFNFDWETVSGSVNNEFTSGKCGKHGSQTIGDGSARINIETVSGSIRINKE